jgi:hypothetical protein
MAPDGGEVAEGALVTITTASVGASIRYTTDGSDPSATVGTEYTVPVEILNDTTLKAIAYGALFSPSNITSRDFTIALPQAEAPVMVPNGGSVVAGTTVEITTASVGASIRYTTDGSDPSSTVGTVYSGPVAINANTTLKAIAYGAGFSDSDITTRAFTVLLAVYWGSSTNPTLDEAGILALADSSNESSPAGSYLFPAPGIPEEYLYFAWPDSFAAQPRALDGFMSGPFPVSMAGAAEGYDQLENGWAYLLVDVGGVPYRLYRTFWPLELEFTITVNT